MNITDTLDTSELSQFSLDCSFECCWFWEDAEGGFFMLFEHILYNKYIENLLIFEVSRLFWGTGRGEGRQKDRGHTGTSKHIFH